VLRCGAVEKDVREREWPETQAHSRYSRLGPHLRSHNLFRSASPLPAALH
jgi:hypothetical protein